MNQNQRHKTGRKSSHRQERGIDFFLPARLFIILGAIFLLVGLYFALGSLHDSTNITELLKSILKPTNEAPLAEFSGRGFSILLLYFLPGILILTFTSIFAKKYNSITYPLTLSVAVYFIVIQIYVFIFAAGIFSFPSFFVALLFLFLPTIMLISSAILHQKSSILILTILYFYVSIILYTSLRPFNYLIPFILLFSILFYLVYQKIKKPSINLVNFFFAIGFFGLFWLRKLVINSNSDYLPDFFIFGILFYLLFYTITLLASSNKERPLRRWMQAVLSWGNLLFFLGTTSFVLVKYYSFGYLWVLVSGLLLINIAGIYLLKKYKSTAWVLPQYFGVLFLAALLLPVLFQQGRVLLFTAVFSAGMLVYAIEFKNRAAILISFASLAAMLAYYLFSWAFNYLPAFLPAPTLPETALLWHGLLSGLVVSFSLYFTKWFLEKDVVVPLPKKWFSKTRYTRLVRTLMLISVFFTMGWSGFALGCRLTGVLVYSASGWFVAGSIFFIGMITYYSGIQSIFKKPVLYFGFAFAFLYPLLVQWGMYVYLKNLVTHGEFSAAPLVLHYLALALLLALGIMTVRRIYLHLVKYPMLQGTVQAATVFMLLFVVCTEYDTLSVLANSVATGYDAMLGKGEIILPANRYLPYSILMWGLTLAVLLMATLLRLRFLRNFSLILFLPILAKIFIFDFPGLSQGGRSGVFIGLGVFLIGFALVYPRLARGKEKEEKGKIVKSEVNQQSESHPSP